MREDAERELEGKEGVIRKTLAVWRASEEGSEERRTRWNGG
jgi:hypothetical protein